MLRNHTCLSVHAPVLTLESRPSGKTKGRDPVYRFSKSTVVRSYYATSHFTSLQTKRRTRSRHLQEDSNSGHTEQNNHLEQIWLYLFHPYNIGLLSSARLHPTNRVYMGSDPAAVYCRVMSLQYQFSFPISRQAIIFPSRSCTCIVLLLQITVSLCKPLFCSHLDTIV